jgi:hypothetical protein
MIDLSFVVLNQEIATSVLLSVRMDWHAGFGRVVVRSDGQFAATGASNSADRGRPPQSPQPTDSRVGFKLRSGDTLGSVLKRFGVAPPSAHAMIEKLRPFLNPRKVRPGDDVAVVLSSEDRTVQAMEFIVDDALVRVKATNQGWFAERHEIPFVREKQVVRGTVKGSLYESGTEAGLTPQHIVDLGEGLRIRYRLLLRLSARRRI